MLNGYKFPVNTTAFCPRDQTEWIERSSLFKCTRKNSYTCVPNENITVLLEFCYPLENIAIREGKLVIPFKTFTEFITNLYSLKQNCFTKMTISYSLV